MTENKEKNEETKGSAFVSSQTMSHTIEVEERLDTSLPRWEMLKQYHDTMRDISNTLRTASINEKERYYKNYMYYHFLFIPFMALILFNEKALVNYSLLTIQFLSGGRTGLPTRTINFLMKENKTFLGLMKKKFIIATLPLFYVFKLRNKIGEITHYFE